MSRGRKAWSSETEDFFCCHGTLVQANASFDRGIYYQIREGEGLAVSQFFNSTLKTSINDTTVDVKQVIDTLSGNRLFTSSVTYGQAVTDVTAVYPHNPNTLRVILDIAAERAVSFELKIRVPFWIKGEPVLYVNDEKQTLSVNEGWISVTRNWNRDKVIFEFKKGITTWPLPDRPDTTAFLYGPVVLAGLCDEEIRLEGDIANPEQFIVHDNEREWGMWMNTFKTTGQMRNNRMVPLYKIGYEPYMVYFPTVNNPKKQP
jgi:DUF1680 family protein